MSELERIDDPSAALQALARISALVGEERSDAIDAFARDPLARTVIDRPSTFQTERAFWDVAYAWWRNQIEDINHVEGFEECGRWLERMGADEDHVLLWAARLAWYHRGLARFSDAAWPSSAGSSDYFRTVVECSWLRFFFKFRRLEDRVDRALEHWPRNAYFLALDAFSRLAQDDKSGDGQLNLLWPQVKDDTSVPGVLARRVCLDALWVAPANVDRMTLLRSYCEYDLATHTADDRDYIVYYTLAYACRHLEAYEAATQAITRALATLRGESIDFLNEQFLRERDFISVEARTSVVRNDLQQLTLRLAEAKQGVAEVESRLNEQISQHTIRLVEVLGLFAAIVAFLLGGFRVASAAKSVWQALLLIGGTGLVSILFYVAVILVISQRTQRTSIRRDGQEIGRHQRPQDREHE